MTGDLHVNGGALHGLRGGDILEVHPIGNVSTAPTGDAGHVRVTATGMTSSLVESVAHGSVALREAAGLDGWQGDVVYGEHSSSRLRVVVSDDVAAPLASELQRCVASDANAGRLVEFVGHGEAATWGITYDGDELVLSPIGAGELRKTRYPVVGEGLRANLANMVTDITSIARAEGLLRAASSCQTGSGLGLKVDIETVSSSPARGVAFGMPPGERFSLVMSNTGRRPLDVTVLHVSAARVITCLFPDGLRGESSRLERDDTRRLKLRCDAKPVGREWIVVLAVQGIGAPVDFSCLATAGGDDRRSMTRGPLAVILDVAVGGEGGTRGLSRAESDSCSADVLAIDTGSRGR